MGFKLEARYLNFPNQFVSPASNTIENVLVEHPDLDLMMLVLSTMYATKTDGRKKSNRIQLTWFFASDFFG
jgi:hypothetical protein